ncbi:ion channel [Vitiosangium sp. GDMCC 1.1324]|uniref:ion channel n=1 Tax=Vitiosangium sp. (strain GDMCC 1.1324) TaxID=2138576 RepID=UPI00130E81E8|nr:ion channel [Vitiosangium sp. GDMCC 1.1324]
MRNRPLRSTFPGADYQLKVIGHRPTPLRDFYHALLRMPWAGTFAVISGLYLLANMLFALGFLLTGGVAHAAPGSFSDAFFFSVQTMGTIGYGAMYPESVPAHILVVAESIVGLSITALATGLVFAKFSLSRARVQFTRNAVITLMNGVPTLMFRLGNERGNRIVNAEIRVVLTRTERTSEGITFYRSYDLRLVRDRALSLSRSWSALHIIDRDSPLCGQTPESLRAQEVELQVMVLGIDDITLQSLHAGHRYFAAQILWGSKLVDILSEDKEGDMVLDLRRFHDTEPTPSTPDFPYPKAS